MPHPSSCTGLRGREPELPAPAKEEQSPGWKGGFTRLPSAVWAQPCSLHRGLSCSSHLNLARGSRGSNPDSVSATSSADPRIRNVQGA